MSSGKPEGLGFDGWLNKLKSEFGDPAEQGAFDPNEPMDDIAKMRRLMAIDRRYMYATMGARPGRTTQATVEELKAIAGDYEQLLKAGTPQMFYKENELRVKIADSTKAAAQACVDLREYREAAKLYRAAAAAYKTLGKPEEAKRCQERVAELKYPQDGNVDDEIQRLRKKIAKVAAPIDQADALIELGTLYNGNGDDFEARKLLEKAEVILKEHAPDPNGAALANALNASLLGMAAGKPPGLGGIETTLRVQGLYRLLYVALARTHEATNPRKAAEYRAKAGQRDSREVNDDFSQTMLRMLQGDLGKMS
jgi:tetratricopeptide (TPR) repeat protein